MPLAVTCFAAPLRKREESEVEHRRQAWVLGQEPIDVVELLVLEPNPKDPSDEQPTAVHRLDP